MSKLDDLLGKKKTIVPVLDLSKTLVQSKEEFKRLMEKVPDYKMRPIKVRGEEIKIKDKDYAFKTPRKEMKKLLKNNGNRELLYTYLDPIPGEMRSVVLMDLCSVPIDWKMLTTLKPKTKLEEDYFSRLIEMGKIQLKTEMRDKREYQLNPGIRKVKNKSGILETRLNTCPECGEELCTGRTCTDCSYDLYVRIEMKPTKPKPLIKIANNKHGGNFNSRKKATTASAGGGKQRKTKNRSMSKSPEKKSKEKN